MRLHERRGGNATRSRRRTDTRRYGPRCGISEQDLNLFKMWRNFFLTHYDYDIINEPWFSKYKKCLEGEDADGMNSDDEDDATEEEKNNDIHVEKVDLCPLANAFDHHTSEYKCIRKRVVDGKEKAAELVIRRGAPFKIKVTFDRKYEAKLHDLKLQFRLGIDPSDDPETEVTVMVDEKNEAFDNNGKWQARILSRLPSQQVDLEILSPPDCIIGNWKLHIFTISKDKRGKEKELHYKHDVAIYIILNPWCKDDAVFFPEDPSYTTSVDPRKEYVENPLGAVYTSRKAKPWRFAQFEENILQIALTIVQSHFHGNVKHMGDPVKIARAISSVINSNDNRGVLHGNWSGNYEDGVRPSSWEDSSRILRQYYRQNKPVKYGQCWVFSAVAVTVCRAIGLPCRSITNISSAHDADGTIDIEYIIEADGSENSSDSIWNFHVWNEAWMTRPDLKEKKYDGWQVFDATPQEMSGGIYQCGPCPVLAVKEGNTHILHDTTFVYAEVNANVEYYFRTPVGLEWSHSDTDGVGKEIITKRPDGRPIGDSGRYLATSSYKHREGSKRDRAAGRRALANTPGAFKELKDNITIKKSNSAVGDDIDIQIIVRNDHEKNRREVYWMQVILMSVDYTNVHKTVVKEVDVGTVVILPREVATIPFHVAPDEYEDKLQDMSMFKIVVRAKPRKRDPFYTIDDDFILDSPFMDISASVSSCKVNEEVEVTVTVRNPLHKNLTNCVLRIDDEKFDDIPDRDLGIIKVGGEKTEKLKLKALRPGPGEVIVALESKEFNDIRSDIVINIKE